MLAPVKRPQPARPDASLPPAGPRRPGRSLSPVVTRSATWWRWLLPGLVLTSFGFGPVGPAQAQTAGATPQAQAEYEKFRSEQDMMARARRDAEVKRLQPLVASMQQSKDRAALAALKEQISTSTSLDTSSRQQLLAPLLDREVLLLCADALTALSDGELETGRRLIIGASHAYAQRPGPPTHVTGAIAQVQARYIAAAADTANKAGTDQRDMVRAGELIERAEGMVLLLVDPAGPASKQAQARLGQVKQQLSLLETGSVLDRARFAEQNRDFRLALYLYRDAARRGADIGDSIARIDDERRSPGGEALMSALIPGLGQITHGRPVTGALFLVSTAAAVAGGVMLNKAAEDRYDRYQATDDPQRADNLYSGVNQRWGLSLGAFGVAAILYTWNILDARADAKEFNRVHF